VEAVEVEVAVPSEGVEGGGDDAEAARPGNGSGRGRVRWSARESIGFVVRFLQLGLAEDSGHPHLIVTAASRNEGEKVSFMFYVSCL
jgi:hypothetical protein